MNWLALVLIVIQVSLVISRTVHRDTITPVDERLAQDIYDAINECSQSNRSSNRSECIINKLVKAYFSIDFTVLIGDEFADIKSRIIINRFISVTETDGDHYMVVADNRSQVRVSTEPRTGYCGNNSICRIQLPGSRKISALRVGNRVELSKLLKIITWIGRRCDLDRFETSRLKLTRLALKYVQEAFGQKDWFVVVAVDDWHEFVFPDPDHWFVWKFDDVGLWFTLFRR